MSKKQIQETVEARLRELEPTEVRVHIESDDVLKVLVLSDMFRGMALGKRITACVNLLCDSVTNEDDDLPYLFIVEPVTPEEFKERLMPWPE